MKLSNCIFTLALALVGLPALAQDDLTLTTEEKAPPEAVSEEIRGALDSHAVVLAKGEEPAWEFWFCKTVAISSAPAQGHAGPEAIKPTTLLGVVTLHREVRDFKDNVIEKGTYTMRYGQQPTDGNHLGTATHNHFAVLIPVKYDSKIEAAWDADGMADESMANSVAEHPINLNLQPVDAEGDRPVFGEGADDAQLVKIALTGEAEGKTAPLHIGLVFKGTGHL